MDGLGRARHRPGERARVAVVQLVLTGDQRDQTAEMAPERVPRRCAEDEQLERAGEG